jgi:cytochrome oxidase assembly protein ShyY1
MAIDDAQTRSRWVTVTAFALIVSVACVFLARWQWQRLQSREAKNAVIVENFDQPAVAIESLLAPGTAVGDDTLWRQIEATGEYASADEVLVRKRSLNESTGYWVLTPLKTATGVVLWCNRGWIRAGEDARSSAPVPPAPTGTVTVTGHLRQAEGASDDEGLPTGQVQRIDTDSLAERVQAPVFDAWLQVTDEDPAPSSTPVRLPPPQVSGGPHLGYAIQWAIFAIAAWVGWWVILRRSVDEDEDFDLDPPERLDPVPPPTDDNGR